MRSYNNYRYIEDELKKAESIAPAVKNDDLFKKIEEQLGDFHAGLLAFFKIHETIEYINSQSVTSEFERVLYRTIDFFDTLEHQAGMLEIPKTFIKLFREIIEANDEYESGMLDAGCLDKHADLVEEAVSNSFYERVEELQIEYSSLVDAFFKDLDEFIGENTVFRIPEKIAT
ncbi:MAG: hypothetical protein K8R73_13895 [Clostridiales bacterium]|nr:hypothetical protein [Clostridiales bacterium]